MMLGIGSLGYAECGLNVTAPEGKLKESDVLAALVVED